MNSHAMNENGIFVPTKNKATVKGVYRLTKCDISTPEARSMADFVVLEAKKGWHAYRKALEEFHKAFMLWQSSPIENLVVDRGLEMLARIITGDVSYTGVLNYCALGDSNTAVNAVDTALGNEVYRKTITSTTFSANEAYASTFFNQAEIVDTIEEVGHFVDGSATTDSGRLFSRIEAADTAELPVTKGATETLTVDYKVTFANA